MRAVPTIVAALCLGLAAVAQAVPLQPARGDEVVERLGPAAPRRGAAPLDAAPAVAAAAAAMTQARRDGDPRPAGRALALLSRWAEDAQAPAAVVIALADVEQYLHRFDAAAARLAALVRRDPRQPQAWLMLATLHRVAGRYADSDAACRALIALRTPPYGEACAAENDGLRGRFAPARERLLALRATAADAAQRAWLSTSLAELEQRAGRPQAAEAAWREALAAVPDDGYARIGLADLLLARDRPAEAMAVLADAPASEGVLLRQAIAARRAGGPQAEALAARLLERRRQADLRQEDGGHERERALIALELQRDPAAALVAATLNLQRQREPIDLLIAARAAQQAGDRATLERVRRLAREQDLHDARLDAL